MWFDSVIGFFNPKSQVRREAYRTAIKTIKDHNRKYEGAAKGRRTDGWCTSGASINAETGPALAQLRNRSRDLIRNNPYAGRGVNLIEVNTIGDGIVPNWADDNLQALWRDWAETTACDFEGRLTFYDIQALVMRSVVESGEVIVRRRVSRDKNSPIPFKLQVLESDFISSELDQIKRANNDNVVIQGVEFDSKGRRKAYHLYEQHPGAQGLELQFGKKMYSSVRVPASEILHPFKLLRPGQIRGVPWLHKILIRLRDLDEYEDAQLVRQKIAACFSVFVKDAIDADTDLTQSEKEELGSKVEPGLIEFLPPGKEIQLANPPTVENYAEYMGVNLHAIASGLDLSYEALTGNLSEVNFSSARMGWLEMHRAIVSYRKRIMGPQVNDPVTNWFLQGAQIAGIIRDMPSEKPRWVAPRREMIDPTKEVPALKDAVRCGFVSWSDAVLQSGENPEDHAAQMARDNELIDRHELALDCDGRRVDGKGKTHDDGEESENENDDGDS